MKSKLIIIIMVASFSTAGFTQENNPFFTEWLTPFGVPPFQDIRNEHYMPAFLRGMEEQKKEIEAIINNPAVPTFENTIVALDRSGALLDKINPVFSGLNSANTNKEMQEIAKQLSPLTTKHSDDISLNPELFARVKRVYETLNEQKLTAEQERLTEESYKNFVRGGANLDSASQVKLRALNKEINLLQISFGQNLLAETNGFQLVVDNRSDLSGLPENLVTQAKEAGNKNRETSGKWVFGLQNPIVMPFLQFSDNRALRERLYNAYISRCNNNNDKDNKQVIVKLVKLRQEKAALLGYSDFASYALENRMAKTSENVYTLLNTIWEPALLKAKSEAEFMMPLLQQDAPGATFEPWDWRYYSEKLLKARFNLGEDELKPYFRMENVRDGIFFVANKLYGLTFTEVNDAPTYYPGVKLYECKDADGSHLGVLYFDLHPRESKRGGAWCGTYRSQSYKDDKRVAPVVTIVCNFTAPTTDKPALLTADEVQTLFHEFGHALHNLLKDVKYRGLAGVPRDFVELPSQIMEHWAFEPEVLRVYAKHYNTGKTIPNDLIQKIGQSEKYGQGFKTTEYLAASYLDMDYHVIKDTSAIDVLAFEKGAMTKIGLIPQIQPRYRSTYFQHTMTGGYTAGYYSYIWAEVLDADAFEAFRETGDIFNREVAGKFRKMILEKGGSMDAMQMYMEFRGKRPGIEPLLKNRGLN
jgi:peptidyl-dipeptidase Dcp